MTGFRKKFKKLTKLYFETIFLIAGGCKLAPFHVIRTGTDSYRSYKLHQKPYQKALVCAAECGLLGLTFYHLLSFKAYVSQNGLDMRSTIYVTYVLAYTVASLFSITGTLHGADAVVLLNSIQGSRKSDPFSGDSWDSDFFLQLFTLQMIQLCGSISVASGFLLPWLYPNGPWMLTHRVPWFRSLPLHVRVPSTCAIEFVNFFIPVISCLGNAQVFMIAFTCIKLSLQRLRYCLFDYYAEYLN